MLLILDRGCVKDVPMEGKMVLVCTQDIDLMMIYCWTRITDNWPTVNKHCVNVFSLLGGTRF